MSKKVVLVAALGVLMLVMASPACAQVLGPCGTKDAQKPAAAPAPAATAAPAAPAAPAVSRLLLPGDQAPNFKLAAIVGKQVKEIKLSDYDGKWRVVCFYPADFTFV